MSDQAPAFIRTYVPLLVGAAVTWAASRHNIVIDETTSQAAIIALTGAASAVYYAAVRVIEARFPAFGVLLGYTAQPSYDGDPVDGNPADMAHEPIRVPALVAALGLVIAAPLGVWLAGEGHHEAAAAVAAVTAGGGLLSYAESRRARVDSPATTQARYEAESVARVEPSDTVEEFEVELPGDPASVGLPIVFESPTETEALGLG